MLISLEHPKSNPCQSINFIYMLKSNPLIVLIPIKTNRIKMNNIGRIKKIGLSSSFLAFGTRTDLWVGKPLENSILFSFRVTPPQEQISLKSPVFFMLMEIFSRG